MATYCERNCLTCDTVAMPTPN